MQNVTRHWFYFRVGGGRSAIDDRRNWDGYIVNNKVVRLSSIEGKKMMGLPNNFKFPVTENQAMKQLGNSVAVTAIKHTSKQIIKYLRDRKIFQKRKNLRFNFKFISYMN